MFSFALQPVDLVAAAAGLVPAVASVVPSGCPASLSAPAARLALGSGQQAFALRHLAGGLAGAANRFALLAGALLRRLFVGAAALHLAKKAFALELLLEGPQGLVDIVVANENLQWTSPYPMA